MAEVKQNDCIIEVTFSNLSGFSDEDKEMISNEIQRFMLSVHNRLEDKETFGSSNTGYVVKEDE